MNSYIPELIAPERAGFSSARLARLSAAMQRYVDDGKLAGIVTLLAKRDRVFHFERFGMADQEAKQAMGLDTIFRIYSMTKPITTVAAMMLYEEGHFQLDDPVASYIPAFKETKVYSHSLPTGHQLVPQNPAMTIRDLMSHLSGLSYGWYKDSPIEDEYRARRQQASGLPLAGFVEELAQLPLLHQPYSQWRYSFSTDVLGYLVEVISGMALDQFLQKHIFERLGMHETGFYVPEEKLHRFAAMYAPIENYTFDTELPEDHQMEGRAKVMDAPKTSAFAKPPAMLSGGGGLVSTASDYLRFAQMLLNGGTLDGERILGRKTLELMTLNHVPERLLPIDIGGFRQEGTGFGLGFKVLMDVAKSCAPGSVGNFGWSGAATTFFWVDPVEEFTGIFMTQFMPSGYHPVTREFQMLAYQAID